MAKKHPATRGITVDHACGHSSEHRVSLGPWSGAEKSRENTVSVANLLASEIARRVDSSCLECLAAESHAQSRSSLEFYFTTFRLETPGELTGSIRQKAWGESVRSEAVHDTIEHTIRLFAHIPLGLSIFNSLHSQGLKDLPNSVVELAHEYRKALTNSEHIYIGSLELIKDIRLLAAAGIAIRTALHEFIEHSTVHNSAQRWGLWSKYRSGGTRFAQSYTRDPYLIVNTLMTLNILEDDSLVAADVLIAELSTNYPSKYKRAVESHLLDGESPYQSIELMKVQQALDANNAPLMWPPF